MQLSCAAGESFEAAAIDVKDADDGSKVVDLGLARGAARASC